MAAPRDKPRRSMRRAAAELGIGVKSQRRFCDVFVATKPADSVAVSIPAHTGAATLIFDLHPRFTVPAATTDPGAGVRAALGARCRRPAERRVIDSAAVTREFRTGRICSIASAARGRAA